MTAKRFKHSEIIQDDGQIICYGIEDTQTRHIFNVPFVDDGLYEVSEKELIKLLNELHEENERLHNEVFRLKTELAYDRTVNDGKDWFKAEDEHLTFKTEKW